MAENVINVVAALIRDEGGRVLLVRKRGTAAFMQPGGKRDAGESDVAALSREIVEELGCRVIENSAQALGVFDCAAANEPGFQVRAAVYAVDVEGAVTPQAEDAFRRALVIDPHETGSRYYMGMAYAARGQNAAAMAIWESLLADAPPNAPWRGELVDRLASLKAASGGGPDISAMVAGLAARLKTSPNDLQGWQRLIRAYTVLGDDAKAHEALSDARKALSAQKDALTALAAEAKQLKLD